MSLDLEQSYAVLNDENEIGHVIDEDHTIYNTLVEKVRNVRLIPRHRLSDRCYSQLLQLYPHASNSVLTRCGLIEHPIKHAINQFWTEYCMWATRLAGDRPCYVGVNPYYLNSHEVANNYLQGCEPYFEDRDNKTKLSNKRLARSEYKKLSAQKKEDLQKYSGFVFCFAEPTQDVPNDVPVFILNYEPLLFSEPSMTQDGEYRYKDGFMVFKNNDEDVYVYDAHPVQRQCDGGVLALGGGVALYLNKPAFYLLYNLLTRDVYATFNHRRGLHVAVASKNRRYNLASALMHEGDDFIPSWASLHSRERIKIPDGYYRYDYFNFKVDNVLQCVRIAIAQYEWYVNHREATNFPNNLSLAAVCLFCGEKGYPVIDTNQDGNLPDAFLATTTGHLIFMSNKPPTFDEEFMRSCLKSVPTARGFEYFDMPEVKDTKALAAFLKTFSDRNANGQETSALKGEPSRDEFKAALDKPGSPLWKRFKSGTAVSRVMQALNFTGREIKKAKEHVQRLAKVKKPAGSTKGDGAVNSKRDEENKEKAPQSGQPDDKPAAPIEEGVGSSPAKKGKESDHQDAGKGEKKNGLGERGAHYERNKRKREKQKERLLAAKNAEVSKNKNPSPDPDAKKEEPEAKADAAIPAAPVEGAKVDIPTTASSLEQVRIQREANKRQEEKEFADELTTWKRRIFGEANAVNVLNPKTMCSLPSTDNLWYLILSPRKKTLAYYMDYLRYLMAKIREFFTGEVAHFCSHEFTLTSVAPLTGTVIVLPAVTATLMRSYRMVGTEVGNNEMQAILTYFENSEKMTCFALIADFLGLAKEMRLYGRQDLCSTVQRLGISLTETFASLRNALSSHVHGLRRFITPLISSMISTCSSMIANATGVLRSLLEWATSVCRAMLSKMKPRGTTSGGESSASQAMSSTPQPVQPQSSSTCIQPSEGDILEPSPDCPGCRTPSDYSLNQNQYLKQESCAPHESSTRSISATISRCRLSLPNLRRCFSTACRALRDVILTKLPRCLKICHYVLVLSLSQMFQNLTIVCHLPLDPQFWKRYIILLMSPSCYIRGLMEPNFLMDPSTTKGELSQVKDSLARLLCWPYVLYKAMCRMSFRAIDTLIVETIMSDSYRPGTTIRPWSRVLSICTEALGSILGLRIPARTLLALCSYNVGITHQGVADLAWSAVLADSYLACSSAASNPEPRSFIATFTRSVVANNVVLKTFQSLVKSVMVLGPIAILGYVLGTGTPIYVCTMISIKLTSLIYAIACFYENLLYPSLTACTLRRCLAGAHRINVAWLLEFLGASEQIPSEEEHQVSNPSLEDDPEFTALVNELDEETLTVPSPKSATQLSPDPLTPALSPSSPITEDDADSDDDPDEITIVDSGVHVMSWAEYPVSTYMIGDQYQYKVTISNAPTVYFTSELKPFPVDEKLRLCFDTQFFVSLQFPEGAKPGRYEVLLQCGQYYCVPSQDGEITLEVIVGCRPHGYQIPVIRYQVTFITLFSMTHANFKAALEREQKISSGLNAIVGDLSDEGKRFVYCHCDAGEHAEITPAGIPDQNCMPSVTIWSRFETTTFDASFFGQTPTSYTILITPFPNYPVVVCGEFMVNGVSTTRYVAIEDPTITTQFMVNNTIREFRRIGAAGTMVYTSNVLNQNGTIICNQFPSGNDDFSMPSNLPIKPDTVSRATPLYVRLNIRDGFYMPIKFYEPNYEFVNCVGNTANLTINGSPVYTYATRLNTSPTAAQVLPNTRYCWGVAALSGLAEGASFSLKVSHGYQMLISGPCSLSSLVHPAPFYDVRALQTASLLAGWMAMAYPSRYNDWAAVKRWLAGAMENKTVQAISKTLVNAIPVVGGALSTQVDTLLDQAAKSLRNSAPASNPPKSGRRSRKSKKGGASNLSQNQKELAKRKTRAASF